MNTRDIIFKSLLAASTLTLGSCHHKPLYVAPEKGDTMEIVFDWRYAPDASPASMAAYMFPKDDNPQAAGGLRYIFTGRDGGEVRIPYGSYVAVGMNTDTEEWAVLTGSDNPDRILITTADADILEGRSIPTRMVPRHDAAVQERMAKAPGMLWTDNVDDVILRPSPGKKTVTLYPEERICRYDVRVLDVKNIESLSGGAVDASLSGISEGVYAGHSNASDNAVTMPLVLHPEESGDSMFGKFLTFGDTPVTSNRHILSLYMVLEDGTKWVSTFDVTDQVDNAPDPKNVHIVVRGIDLPDPGRAPTGLVPDVNDWEAVYVDLHM